MALNVLKSNTLNYDNQLYEISKMRFLVNEKLILPLTLLREVLMSGLIFLYGKSLCNSF